MKFLRDHWIAAALVAFLVVAVLYARYRNKKAAGATGASGGTAAALPTAAAAEAATGAPKGTFSWFLR